MMNRKAVVLGGTGLIGSELIQLLVKNSAYSEIRVLGRRNIEIESSKIQFHQINMNEILSESQLFDVDDVFCCLGTTIKKARTQVAFKQVDYQMVLDSAMATEKYAQHFLMVSSLGADTKSSNFYLRTKGEIELKVQALNIPYISIFRPSILFGNRKEQRTGEQIGIAFMKFASPLLMGSLKKYRGNEARTVAQAMIISALARPHKKNIYESFEIEEMINSI